MTVATGEAMPRGVVDLAHAIEGRGVTDTCEADDKRLVDEIVRYVRDGKKLPKPAKAP